MHTAARIYPYLSKFCAGFTTGLRLVVVSAQDRSNYRKAGEREGGA